LKEGKVMDEDMKENSEPRTSNSERLRFSLDEVLVQLTSVEPRGLSDLPVKVLFWGRGTGEISSYVAGWMAGQGIDVVVLDGANRFDPYMVSFFAKKAMIPPEKLLRSIRIARAFTCYQMATLIEEKLFALLHPEGTIEPEFLPSPFRRRRNGARCARCEARRVGGDQDGSTLLKPCVILLGPSTTFLDEDVAEREVRPLFERSLRKAEKMAEEGVPFFLFQPSASSNLPFPSIAQKGGRGRMDSRGSHLIKRLFQFCSLVWEIDLDDQGTKLTLKKSPSLQGEREESRLISHWSKHQIPSTNHQTIDEISMAETPTSTQD